MERQQVLKKTPKWRLPEGPTQKSWEPTTVIMSLKLEYMCDFLQFQGRLLFK
jgi:hypothetical protein